MNHGILDTMKAKFLGPAVLDHYRVEERLVESVYPGIVKGTCDDNVFGELYDIPRYQLKELDEFEGEWYRRITVVITEGNAAEAYEWTPT